MKRKQRGQLAICIISVIMMGMLSGCSDADDLKAQGIDAETEAVVDAESENADGTGENAEGITIFIDDGSEDIEIEVPQDEPQDEPQVDITEETPEAEDNKDVDLIFFMGQSNMSGCGGDASMAPPVKDGAGYEFKSVSDPTQLSPIVEPFGYYESVIGGICDMYGDKRGSLVSSFVNTYHDLTGNVVVAVSASAGATSTEDWLTPGFVADITARMERTQNYLNNNGYHIKHQYVVWLQGESDALDRVSGDVYQSNMDTIIRPLFIGGFSKVFVITPGRIKGNANFFNNIIDSQLDMCRDSSYYALASTMLCAVNTTYMVDDWHYNQKVLNMLGDQAATAVAYYTNTGSEMCIYDYKHGMPYIPSNAAADAVTDFGPLDINQMLSEQ